MFCGATASACRTGADNKPKERDLKRCKGGHFALSAPSEEISRIVLQPNLNRLSEVAYSWGPGVATGY